LGDSVAIVVTAVADRLPVFSMVIVYVSISLGETGFGFPFAVIFRTGAPAMLLLTVAITLDRLLPLASLNWTVALLTIGVPTGGLRASEWHGCMMDMTSHKATAPGIARNMDILWWDNIFITMRLFTCLWVIISQ
jgi:hypothetical protein